MDITNKVYAPLYVGGGLESKKNDTELMNEWQLWGKQFTICQERRDIALIRLQNCLERGQKELTLSYLNLTQLPAHLPDGLNTLDVSHNCLINLPTVLPIFLKKLNVAHNRLCALPSTLPIFLETLEASHNRLIRLPETLPDSLKNLNVDKNFLTHLPTILPFSLVTLDVNYNRLVNLPESLPVFLKELRANSNLLQRVPVFLPRGLVKLSTNCNMLAFLPENLPVSLSFLDVSHNRLICLPKRLPVSLRILYLNHNLLTQAPVALLDFLQILGIDDNPLCDLSKNLLVITHFLKKIKCWDDNTDINPWREIHKEAHAEVFADFLHKLHQGKNPTNSALQYRIVHWLAYLANPSHRELRQQTFQLAYTATENCVDRASFYFNHMHILMMEHQLLNEDAPLNEVVEMIRSTFRLQVLERIAAKQAVLRREKTPNFAEDLEIYLAYQCKLQESLALPIYTTLEFEGIAAIADEDLSQARETVLAEEKIDFGRYWLTESALWTAKLEKWDAEKKAAADNHYLERISSLDFHQMVDNALKERTMSADDVDAYCCLSKIMAAELFFQQRYYLTRECLADYKALSLLDNCGSLLDGEFYVIN